MEVEGQKPQSLREILDEEEERRLFKHYMTVETTAFPHDLAKCDHSSLFRALNDAIGSYLKENPLGLNPGTCTWTDVADELEKSEAEYKRSNKFLHRHGAGMMRSLVPALDCIPSDSGIAPIKGGLMIIFNAVKRRSETCEKILECFSSVTQWLVKAHRLQNLHKRDDKLTNKVREFYCKLFECLSSLISVLLRRDKSSITLSAEPPSRWSEKISKGKSIVGRAFKDVFGDAANEVEDILVPVKSALSSLKEYSRFLDSAGIQTANRNILEASREIKQTRSGVAGLNYKFDQLREEMERRQCETENLVRGRLDDRDNVLKEIWNRVHDMFADALRCTPIADSRPHSSKRLQIMDSQTSRQRQFWNLDINKLLNAIASDEGHETAIFDRDDMVRKQSLFKPKAMSRANQLFETEKFGDWMTSTESEFLMVEGHCLQESQGVVSPLTIFAASLAHVLGAGAFDEESPTEAIPLFFACGQHSSTEDELSGPQGIMRSFISQLLVSNIRWTASAADESRTPDLGFLQERRSIWPEICKQSLGRVDATRSINKDGGNATREPNHKNKNRPERDRLQTLLHLFEELVDQIPQASTVYCIIDGISYYENPWQEDLLLLVKTLAEICDDQRSGLNGPRLKILMTSPGRFYWLHTFAHQEEALKVMLVSLNLGHFARGGSYMFGGNMVRRMEYMRTPRHAPLPRFQSDDFQARGWGQRKKQHLHYDSYGGDDYSERDDRRRARFQHSGPLQLRTRDRSM
ncbi:hypothetical protein MCOR27_008257 [Pyricularia oryzae]|nr:hypothetical protein MCOR27_008257 [Pyricularia oryzae]KAI6324745.1 hypothetical protein MCOR34_001398 [Pyricularia oryzae]KAI6337704.1 hypothetical protein MCOR30_003291 [Pyricularia oryzae]KAI6373500.1 hypothetical protein MCOR31_003163 [Pyricularia oryzae]KAI6436487.1 hypothetical protein MCOR21_001074 [Pyricularia oryzae]